MKKNLKIKTHTRTGTHKHKRYTYPDMTPQNVLPFVGLGKTYQGSLKQC